MSVPFGGHTIPYAAGTLRPSGEPAALDRTVVEAYERWKAAFVRNRCGSFQVISPDADHPHVAEAQGYGMVITATMAGADPDARKIFDGLVDYVLAHPSTGNPDLLAAEQNTSCKSVNGGDSATDGDLDVAYGLLLADRQWGGSGRHDYRRLAVRHIAAIKASEVDPDTHLLTLGDWATPDDPLHRLSRSSDWMIDRFRAFEKATGDADWATIRTAHQDLIAALQKRHDTGLLPDFVRDGKPAKGKVLEDKHDGAYFWNALRDPWRIGDDAVTGGDPRSIAAARKLTAWIRSTTGGDPGRITAGYELDGTPIGEEGEPAFIAPFAVAALAEPSAQTWLDALWKTMASTTFGSDDYFAASVQLQAMITVSGNRWTP
ncbi:glycosyl hydrolase family 8 [Streptosporangium sp. NPDC051022]|uniref:glycosyl hydrolase family 8 n=1 Tax=Streptosporangium sp. NPDC051022 TaxID=3155752 RepID=UPI00341D02ED